MMKHSTKRLKLILFVGFLAFVNCFLGQASYVIGEEVDDSLASFSWFSNGECYDEFYDTDIQFPDSEVAGVSHVLVITNIDFSSGETNSPYTDNFGEIEVGDEIPFDDLVHKLYCPSSVSVKGVFKAKGTPEVEGETYKCGKITFTQAMSECFAWIVYDFEEIGEPIPECEVQPQGCVTENHLTEAVCESYILNGETYTATGNYEQVLKNVQNCDSIIYLDLTILEPSFSEKEESACESYTYNGETYTTSGEYTHVFEAENGCDSTVTLKLTLYNDLNTTVLQSGNTLTAQANDVSYQWLDCEDNTPITGAVEQSFTATENGVYALEISKEGCAIVSECITVNILNLSNKEKLAQQIKLFPNPNKGSFTIENNTQKTLDITIVDALGKKVHNQNISTPQENISLDLPTGVYMANFIQEGNVVIKKVVVR